MLVYKYRSGNKDDLKALENNQYWSSSIEQLNDPCEAITDTKRVKKFLNYVGKKVGAKTEKEFNVINDNTDEVLSLDNKMGIYSLSKTPLDELLWAHYANSHRGFCLEYDLAILLQNDGENHVHSFPVKYSKRPPSIGLFNILSNNQNNMIKKFAFYKSKRWAYEHEHRIVTSKIGLNSYNHKALKSIFFGLKTNGATKNNIINILKGRSVNFYQIKLERNSYSFKAEKLDAGIELESNYLKRLPTSLTKGGIVEFEILKNKIFNSSGIGEFKVMLNQELKKSDMVLLINYLKENLFCEGKILFFDFYTNSKQIDNLPWASATLKNEKIEIEFNYGKL
ncbi:MAG: hypothetical protein CMH47_00810 [Muricauda sp.]|nr:DUF2971 domain-containing protein [uncultured Allomuricauda sp.]MBC70829.1 hypothetical protein [Allomuricauda sp.]|tara:strand:+ start:7842 stop:8855 length:1014 start_codon:yes stop_codon:yes gene_type:complete